MTAQDFTIHARFALTNTGGIEIMINTSQDGVYYRFNYGQADLQGEEIFEAEIQYDQEGHPYFIHMANDPEQKEVYELDSATRVNWLI